jgi:hypothetical protein
MIDFAFVFVFGERASWLIEERRWIINTNRDEFASGKCLSVFISEV